MQNEKPSFRKMSKEEKKIVKARLLATPVDSGEIIMYDGLIKQRAYEKFVKFWARTGDIPSVCGGNGVIGKTGLSMDDLVQIGRIHVMHQIRYYKCFGDKEKYGASLITLIQNYLDNKFFSLSKSFECKKRGKNVKYNECIDNINLSLLGYEIDPEQLYLMNEEMNLNGTDA